MRRVHVNHFEFDSAVYAHSRVRLEHESIFFLVGEFMSLVRSDAETPQLLSTLEKIIDMTVAHCRSEEKVLQQLNHPCLEEQCEAHRSIMGELADFREDMVIGRNMQSVEYSHLLDSLIVHHLREAPGFERLKELATWL